MDSGDSSHPSKIHMFIQTQPVQCILLGLCFYCFMRH